MYPTEHIFWTRVSFSYADVLLAHVCIRHRVRPTERIYNGFTRNMGNTRLYPFAVCRLSSTNNCSGSSSSSQRMKNRENFNVSADAHKWQSTIASTRAKNEKTYALMPWCLRVSLTAVQIPPEEEAEKHVAKSSSVSEYDKKKENGMMSVEAEHL